MMRDTNFWRPAVTWVSNRVLVCYDDLCDTNYRHLIRVTSIINLFFDVNNKANVPDSHGTPM